MISLLSVGIRGILAYGIRADLCPAGKYAALSLIAIADYRLCGWETVPLDTESDLVPLGLSSIEGADNLGKLETISPEHDPKKSKAVRLYKTDRLFSQSFIGRYITAFWTWSRFSASSKISSA